MEGLESLANKRLVIFGCGYVGAAAARAGLSAGLRVEALTRNPARAAELRSAGVRTVIADLAGDAWHSAGREGIAPGADFVLNCVGSGGGGLAGYRRSYVEGMRSVLAWAERGPAGTIVYTSSTSVYPQGDGAIVDERAPTGGSSPTAQILLESEALLRAANAARTRWFILRLAGIYGPGRHHLLDRLRAGAGELPGGGDHRLNLAHRDDICAAIFAAFAAPASVRDEIFNVADNAPESKATVVNWLAEKLGRPSPCFAGGAASSAAAARASARRDFAAPPDRIIGNAKLKTALGWRPSYPSFREGYTAIM